MNKAESVIKKYCGRYARDYHCTVGAIKRKVIFKNTKNTSESVTVLEYLRKKGINESGRIPG